MNEKNPGKKLEFSLRRKIVRNKLLEIKNKAIEEK